MQSPLMDLIFAVENLDQPLCRAFGSAGNRKNARFSRRERLRRRWQLDQSRFRHHDGAVAIGVDDVSGTDTHAKDFDLAAEVDDIGVGMRGCDLACEELKVVRPLIQVTHRSVGDNAQGAYPRWIADCTSPQKAP